MHPVVAEQLLGALAEQGRGDGVAEDERLVVDDEVRRAGGGSRAD
ncbi:hypothetical protein [Nonomuraea sp. NPDC049400]